MCCNPFCDISIFNKVHNICGKAFVNWPYSPTNAKKPQDLFCDNSLWGQGRSKFTLLITLEDIEVYSVYIFFFFTLACISWAYLFHLGVQLNFCFGLNDLCPFCSPRWINTAYGTKSFFSKLKFITQRENELGKEEYYISLSVKQNIIPCDIILSNK